jgi:hypothetical protein
MSLEPPARLRYRRSELGVSRPVGVAGHACGANIPVIPVVQRSSVRNVAAKLAELG